MHEATYQKRVILCVFPGFELLDLAGPTSVFTAANEITGRNFYKVSIASSKGGSVTAQGDVPIQTIPLEQVRPDQSDTLLVVGGLEDHIRRACNDDFMISWWGQSYRRVERYGAICSGVLLLAMAGIIDDRTVTTHWLAAGEINKFSKDVTVLSDAVFFQDGCLWTSAGAACGIHMALGMIQADLGRETKLEVAKLLTIHTVREVSDVQISDFLSAQISSQGRFDGLVNWIIRNLDKRLDVATLAELAAMSERTFARRFKARFGDTPAKFVEQMRVQEGNRLLQSGLTLKQVAVKVGYQSEEGFSIAFQRRFGVKPSCLVQGNRDGVKLGKAA
ncbi:GlxA family transcriptional regulator [Cognatishimia sp. MH4019]|uniref:GlxA family transcriptional regulator n=1 Tax=Cognatishimia sp. MH4019 TaxID=2854030 RepID=UPI001CD4B111|nr:helix-turn-helix domain-containing protein [Cognatishimia sp. MH4019]